MGKEALSANQSSFGRNSCRSESYLISHRAHGGLGETPLWIGEMPIQSSAFGPILPLRELGQGCHALLSHFVDSEGSSDPRETGGAGERLCIGDLGRVGDMRRNRALELPEEDSGRRRVTFSEILPRTTNEERRQRK
jgi:hypothetical protein